MNAPIVVGTDGSTCADRAVEWACDEAALRDRPLHIVHAVEPAPSIYPLLVAPEMGRSLANAGQEILSAAVKAATARQPGIKMTTELVMNTTGPALVDQSARAFEVVLGHRGLGGFTSLLLGSVGLWMAGHADGPIVVVREDAVPDAGEVVVGLGFDEDPAEVLGYAFEAASLRGTPLRIVHAWQQPPVLVATGYSIAFDKVANEVRERSGLVQASWRERYPDVQVAEDIVEEHPVTALCEASRRAALVVVGAHDRKRFEVPLLGSVSHGVLHHAHCPVAVIRGRKQT
ncbi:universal stress protein [Spirillospora sp. NPDC048911]|uniref:universal stress protein n=1 Tax=Spirillospora sp. NPDC048911 TaxID=3364527 RepID=UPI0037187673